MSNKIKLKAPKGVTSIGVGSDVEGEEGEVIEIKSGSVTLDSKEDEALIARLCHSHGFTVDRK